VLSSPGVPRTTDHWLPVDRPGSAVLPVLCDLRDVARAVPPLLVDLTAAPNAVVVNPSLFATYPSALTEEHPPERRRLASARLWIRDSLTGGLWPFLTDPCDPRIPALLAHRSFRHSTAGASYRTCSILRSWPP
jgi:hypothetical protein